MRPIETAASLNAHSPPVIMLFVVLCNYWQHLSSTLEFLACTFVHEMWVGRMLWAKSCPVGRFWACSMFRQNRINCFCGKQFWGFWYFFCWDMDHFAVRFPMSDINWLKENLATFCKPYVPHRLPDKQTNRQRVVLNPPIYGEAEWIFAALQVQIESNW